MKIKVIIITFITAMILEIISINAFTSLINKDWMLMCFVAFIGPFICLPLTHFNIEAKSFKERLFITLIYSLGYVAGIIIIRPLFV